VDSAKKKHPRRTHAGKIHQNMQHSMPQERAVLSLLSVYLSIHGKYEHTHFFNSSWTALSTDRLETTFTHSQRQATAAS